jgi:hypothetical protein
MSVTTWRSTDRIAARSLRLAAAWLLALLPLALAGPASAAVGCPPTHEAAPLKRIGGATVYHGNPDRRESQVPNQQNTDANGHWWNLFKFTDAAKFVVVCNYQDGFRFMLHLPKGVATCRQDARSFTCQSPDPQRNRPPGGAVASHPGQVLPANTASTYRGENDGGRISFEGSFVRAH